MSTELIINASLPETRIALMENGEIQDLLIERAEGKGITGNIYKGRVTRVLPGMQAAFVDIGLEKAAFLYVDDVFVHSEIFEEEEEAGSESAKKVLAEVGGGEAQEGAEAQAHGAQGQAEMGSHAMESSEGVRDVVEHDEHDEGHEAEFADEGHDAEHDFDDEDSEDEDDDQGPMEMGADGDGEDDDVGNRAPSHPGTVAPPSSAGEYQAGEVQSQPGGQSVGGFEGQGSGEGVPSGEGAPAGEGDRERGGRRRHRRGRRGGRFRSRRERGESGQRQGAERQGAERGQAEYPSSFAEQVSETGATVSDRSDVSGEGAAESPVTGERRPTIDSRQAFRSQRSKDRRIPSRSSRRPVRAQVNIQDLLKEGQEVLVQVAKDPIATKGARLTCHISLPGRHLVCMPTIDHVGVSRRIERDDERRKLRDIVERNRPRNLGFIVRTASGRGQAETRIRQDIDYLTHLWDEIREKAAAVTAPALVYEDLNSVLRAIRDWVTEDIDKIIVDSRYHYNDIQRFVSHFMPSLKQKVELYHGDIPIFDAYSISTELSRALERKVWLKSGGYLVIDQAEALVAIDVNTGRYVGKKNLEDTILKTNLEAVQEIAYQLRLRNCGGIIILDLIDMEKEENKQRVYRALEEAIKRDRARPTIIKISELGLVEMTRKRTRDTIVRALCEPCVHCEGKGFIKSKVTVAYECLREIEREVIERDVSKILVQAHPDVIDILAIDERDTLDQIERRYRKQIYLQAVTDSHPEQFEVAGDKKPGKKHGEFSDVVQPLKGASAHEREQRGERGEGRERGRGRDRDRDRGRRGRGRDRDRDRERGGARHREEGRDQTRQHVEGAGDGQNQAIQPVAYADGHDRSAEQDQGQYQEQSQQSAPDQQPGNFGNQGPEGEAGSGNAYDQAEAGAGEGVSGSGGRGEDDDFFENEEDRLAFLRAQAAQDAALARLSSGQGPEQRRGGQGGGRGHGGGGSQGGGGGQGGGDRDRDRGGRRGRRGRRGGRGGDRFRGGGSGGNGGNRDQRDFGNRGPQGGGGDGGGQSGGGDTGGGGAPEGGGGGGGDHSSPPTA